eukprot:COSAG02_NODE_3673_length_6394_cov_306.295314_3_plen_498_part_00
MGASPLLSLPMGGWPTPSVPPSGGGTEYGSSGPAGRGTAWQRQLRKTDSPPFEFTSPRQGVKRRTSGSFFKPATVSSHFGSSLGGAATARPSVTTRLPEAPSTDSISYRPSEFMGATAPRRKPARLRSGYPSPRSLGGSARSSATSQMQMRAPPPTQEHLDAVAHKLREDMRRERQRKQRETDILAYRHVYSMIDVNRNGLVNPAEILLFFKHAGQSGNEERHFWQAFKDLDRDKSATVDFNEFVLVLDQLRRNKTQLQAARVVRKSTAAGADGGKDGDGGLESASAEAGTLPSLFAEEVIGNEGDSTLDQSMTLKAANVAGQVAEESSRPSTTEPLPNGTKFLTEAVEFQRQLLDVYCAVGNIREVSVREMIVDPEEDSRVRTKTGRDILNYRGELGEERDRAQVETPTFLDVADLTVTATGGISNQKGKSLQQQRREYQRQGNLNALRKTQLTVRSTYEKNIEETIEDRYGALEKAAEVIIQDLMGMFRNWSNER